MNLRIGAALVLTSLFALAESREAGAHNVSDWGLDGQRWAVDVDHNGTLDLCRVVQKPNGQAVACTLSPTKRTEDLYAGRTVESGIIDAGYVEGSAFVDFNGDSLLDYCRLVGNRGGPYYVRCTLFDGRNFGETVSSHALDWGYSDTRKWLDVNNDHRADFCRVVGNRREFYLCTLSDGRRGFGKEIKDFVK